MAMTLKELEEEFGKCSKGFKALQRQIGTGEDAFEAVFNVTFGVGLGQTEKPTGTKKAELLDAAARLSEFSSKVRSLDAALADVLYGFAEDAKAVCA